MQKISKDKWIVLGVFAVLVIALIAFSQTRPLEPTAAPAPAQPTAEAPAPDTQPAEEPAAEVHPDTAAQTEEQAAYEKWVLEEFPRRVEGDPMAMGALDAPVVMTEWADYRCPFCSVFAEETLPHLQKYIDDGTLRVEFRDLALFGDESVKAATAARAAGEQGKFFEFQHALFVALPNQGHPDIPDELVLGIVEELGMDVTQFQNDWANPKHLDGVLADSQEAQGHGVSGTPAFVVGTQFMSGAQPLSEFERVIEAEAAKLG
ncbi:MAG: thioredoxin domain-containing protein [Propionibacteriaceae bacterium]|nr:thioredoxin domain-containing protein [Propionibacteriaceae bacterium]